MALSGSTSTGPLSASSTYTLTCTGSGGQSAASVIVTVSSQTGVVVSPRSAALTLSQAQQFTATVAVGGAFTWAVDGVAGGNSTVGTISSTGNYVAPSTPGTHQILATSVVDSTKSGTATVAVTDLAGVFTYHHDLARTGQNLQEYALTRAAVSGGTFGKQWSCAVDGDLYAQPLYVAHLTISGTQRNVVIVATQHDSVYAFDADSGSCVPIWQTSFLIGGATTIPSTAISGCTDILTEFGITGTPVIDPTTQTLYLVAATKEAAGYVQRLHALKITSGAEQPGSPVVISASVINASGATIAFDALQENQRPALALSGGGVFIGWSGRCDTNPYWGWLMRYDTSSLAQTAVQNVAPNGYSGAIWMSGGAPAVDNTGAIFLTTGNGTFDDALGVVPAVAPNNDFSMSFLNLNPSTLAVQDFYTPSQEAAWSGQDSDISASGVTVIADGLGPSAHPNLLVSSDKQGHFWLLDRTFLGRYSSTEVAPVFRTRV